MKQLYTLLFFFVSIAASGQVLEIVRVEQVGDQVNLYYDLDDTNGSQKYTVSLYGSADGFANPLKFVSGDINTTPGKNRKIVWNMTQEFGSNYGSTNTESISFELRAEIFRPYAVILENYTSLRRGRSYPLNWVLNGDGPVIVQLIKDGELVWSNAAGSTNTVYNLELSKKLKLGNYRIRLVSQNDTGLNTVTEPFKVRGKVPFIVKALPVVALGIVFAVLPKGNKSPGTRLPDPALPQ